MAGTGKKAYLFSVSCFILQPGLIFWKCTPAELDGPYVPQKNIMLVPFNSFQVPPLLPKSWNRGINLANSFLSSPNFSPSFSFLVQKMCFGTSSETRPKRQGRGGTFGVAMNSPIFLDWWFCLPDGNFFGRARKKAYLFIVTLLLCKTHKHCAWFHLMATWPKPSFGAPATTTISRRKVQLLSRFGCINTPASLQVDDHQLSLYSEKSSHNSCPKAIIGK